MLIFCYISLVVSARIGIFFAKRVTKDGFKSINYMYVYSKAGKLRYIHHFEECSHMTSEEKNPLNIVYGKAFILLLLGLHKNTKPTNSPSCMLPV